MEVKNVETIQEYIDLINCFEDCNKFYWIGKLKVSKGIKGFLTHYFNL